MIMLDRTFAALEAAALRLALATAERRNLVTDRPERVWRKARLLWPQFTKG
jgi:hypothetical protein